MSQIPPPFKFLFEAHFADGEVIQQKQRHEDFLPDEPKRNTFTRVLRKLESTPLNFFVLREVDAEVPRFFAVDLQDGKFECCGVIFFAQPTTRNYPAGGTYELIYFHEVQQHTQVDMATDNVVGVTEERAYRIGWKYVVQGKVYEQTIVVA